MSDTTPRPDEPQPADPTAPPPPPAADVPPPPADLPPPPPAAEPYPQPYPASPPPQQSWTPPAGTPAYAPAAANPMSPAEERQWGMLSHVIGLVAMVLSAGFLGFVASLVLYLVYKDRGPFVRAHAANSLNVQITAFIGFVVGVILLFVLIGFFVLPAVFIWAVVVHILGAMKANNGEWYDPPLAIKFVR